MGYDFARPPSPQETWARRRVSKGIPWLVYEAQEYEKIHGEEEAF